jgi:membrane protein implicated in regulation of membrane protease activity
VNFGDLDAHWWWLLLAALLAMVEIVAPGIFSIWIAAAAALTGLAVLTLDIPFVFQCALFALLSIAAVAVGRRWYERFPVTSEDPKLNDRTARLIGQTVTVVVAIAGGEGRVKVGDSVWTARGPDVPEGSRVRIVAAEGGSLRVTPADGPPALGGS